MKTINNREKTLEVIIKANKGIELSESFDNVDDLMAALNELDTAADDVKTSVLTEYDEAKTMKSFF